MKTFKRGLVAFLGLPNAGKSSLLNSILGSRLVAVSPKPQTTQNKIMGIYSEPEVGQILFLDTPGWHISHQRPLNEFMRDQLHESLKEADLVIVLMDPTAAPRTLETFWNHVRGISKPIFVIKSKADLKKSLPFDCAIDLEVSSVSPQGLKALINQIFQRLPNGEPYYDDLEMLSDRPMKFFFREQIREQLFLSLGSELPYETNVEVLSVRESPDITHIDAQLHVERESQKAIVVGTKGQKIKEIGSLTRARLEALVGKKIFLGLRVCVTKGWTKNRDYIERANQ